VRTHQQESSLQKDYQPNYLILDALHSATASFNRINSTINHTAGASQEDNNKEMCQYID